MKMAVDSPSTETTSLSDRKPSCMGPNLEFVNSLGFSGLFGVIFLQTFCTVSVQNIFYVRLWDFQWDSLG